MPSRRFILFLIGFCLAGGLQARTAQEQSIDTHVIDNESISPEAYWTKERMETAEPAPLPTSGETAAGSSCQTPNGLLFLTDVSKHPYESAGRLYFRAGVSNLFCTAQFTESGRILLTAAHCVRDDQGHWFSHFYFVQGDDNGQGQRVELSLVATWHKYWYPTLNRAFDYAFFHTRSFSSRKWLRLGAPDSHPFWLAIGYPENSEYMGKKMVQIMGPRGFRDPAPGIVQMLGNPMKRGASGGGWIANASMCPSACSEVVGIMASRDIEHCVVNSPLFNDETHQLLRYVRQAGK